MNDKKTPVETITHPQTRANIPPAEMESVLQPEDRETLKVAYERRNRDLDPQLVWRGKDVSDWSDLVVEAPPIYLQEQVHPKALIEDLRAHAANGRARSGSNGEGPSLFDHFGLTEEDREAEVEFYRHTRKWSNRMILGDSLQVMAALANAERDGLRGKVQCIYIDPPYGIRFNSNFQWSTTSPRDVKDGNLAHLTREPEQVKAFRDTWRDGIHSYLTYLRDRLTVARELLTESGSCFVQIGDENVHRVRALMDEVFGDANLIGQIGFVKTSGLASQFLASRLDYLLWYGKNRERTKFRQPYRFKSLDEGGAETYNWIRNQAGDYRGLRGKEKASGTAPDGYRLYKPSDITSQGNPRVDVTFEGRSFSPRAKTNLRGLRNLEKAGRIHGARNSVQFVRYLDDFPITPIPELWTDTSTGSFTDEKIYVVQTGTKTVQRCILMTTDPGDLVLDPTCGSGTAAYVAEQWGRRWITIDTSRVSLALARARIMGAKFPYYMLADSPEGLAKEAEITRSAPSTRETHGDIRQGFVYERVPHITLKSIAKNTEIDVIWERLQPAVDEALEELNFRLQDHSLPFKVTTGGRAGEEIDFRDLPTGEYLLPSGEYAPANGFMEWEVPREAPDDWPEQAKQALDDFWEARIARQREIDASIAARAEQELLYDRPYEDKKRIRVAGPFTVESLSPHRSVAVDEHGELIDTLDAAEGMRRRESQEAENYYEAMLENLRKAGVQQRDRDARLEFTSLKPWPGEYVSADGRYQEGETEKRAAIFIGPEYGTVQRADLVAAAREAGEAGFDVLIACAFNYDAHAGEISRLGAVPILRARMNADLHMAGDLKAGGGKLFVVFGEPDIELEPDGDRWRVRLKGVDSFKPQTGEVVSSDAEDIACWFVDTDYDMESFFVRHAYFPSADVPYKALKNTLKAEIDEDAWDSLKRTVSRPFPKPKSGRIAVKVINHLGDEVMKVLRV